MLKRTVVITGASDGVGAAAARQLAAPGEVFHLLARPLAARDVTAVGRF